MPETTEQAIHTPGTWHTTRRLRAALRTNAVFSVISGVALLATGWWLAGPWALGPTIAPPVVGAGVAGFGVLVARIAVEPTGRLRRMAAGIVAADLGWVAASAVLLAGTDRPAIGTVTIAAVAVVVAALAIWQVAGITTARTDDPLASIEIIEASTVIAMPPERIWPLLTDHNLYGRLAPNLSAVEVISEPGATLRRRCTNTSGNSWEETCTLWEAGRRFAVEVDTSDYPYPLAVMRGLWQVDSHPGGSLVTMRFAYQADRTVQGGLFAIALRPLFPPSLARIFAGWRTQLDTSSTPGVTSPDVQ